MRLARDEARMHAVRACSVFLLLAVTAACDEAATNDAGVVDAGAVDAGTADAGIGEIHFADVRARFLGGCGLASCHRFAAEHNAGLAIHLSVPEADLYAELVNAHTGTVAERPPTNVPMRVVPFRPRESFLLWKLTGHDPDDPTVPVAGARMPLGATVYFSDADLAYLRAWIEAGAPR